MITIEFLVYWAGFVLAMITLANFIAPGMLGYKENLAKVDTFIRQVFCVHCGYTVLMLVGMILACVFYNAELIANEGLAKGLNIFLAVFWGSRVIVQVVFYDKAIKKKYPIFNVMFFVAFAYLAVIFTFLTIN